MKEREFYGEKITPETPLFRSAYRRKKADDGVKPLVYDALKGSMYDIVQRAKIRKKLPDSGMRHEKAQFGGFRKWFETTLNNINDINPNVTEKLMGHRNDLRGTYYNPDIRVRFENFKKAIPELIIDESEKLRIENKNKQKKIQELESDKKRISELELKIENISELLKRVTQS